MIIEPRVRGFICTTAHPAGLKERLIRDAAYCEKTFAGKPAAFKRALIIGASMGYGLAARNALAFGCGASTVGVIFDRPASGTRTASAGWYNTAAFEELAEKKGIKSASVNGDAFSYEVKEKTAEEVKKVMGKADLVIYSLAAPRRTGPDGKVWSSVLKTVGQPYTQKTIDLRSREVTSVTIDPASEEEIEATVKVMGGEDWLSWINYLKEADAIEEGAKTVAFSYIGPELTHPIYLNGTIGTAKKHLKDTAEIISSEGTKAFVSVNKALVTQSSAAIPVVPLYISLLYKVMKEKGIHEGCIEQMCRLIGKIENCEVDCEGYIRLDDFEMRPDVQSEVAELFRTVNTQNVKELSDLSGYDKDFLELFGFGIEGVDYTAETETEIVVSNLV